MKRDGRNMIGWKGKRCVFGADATSHTQHACKQCQAGVRYEVLAAVNNKIDFLWAATPCSSLDGISIIF